MTLVIHSSWPIHECSLAIARTLQHGPPDGAVWVIFLAATYWKQSANLASLAIERGADENQANDSGLFRMRDSDGHACLGARYNILAWQRLLLQLRASRITEDDGV